MSKYNYAGLIAQIASLINDNTNQEVTMADIRQAFTDTLDSVPFLGDAETITNTHTFTVSPIVPDPTAENHAVNLGYVRLMVQGVADLTQGEVLSRFDPTAATPAAPTTGDRYISTATANGWTIHNIYEWNGASWDGTAPTSGMTAVVDDEDKQYLYNDTAWVSFGSLVNHAILNNLQGGTSGEYYHLTSAQHTGLTSKSVNETITGDRAFSGAVDCTGSFKFTQRLRTTATSSALSVNDKSIILGVTAASTQTLPLSSTLSDGWNAIIDNQIAAGGTVTINKNASDSTGIIKHEGGDVDVPLLETKYTSATIWWDGTSFHIRGRIT